MKYDRLIQISICVIAMAVVSNSTAGEYYAGPDHDEGQGLAFYSPTFIINGLPGEVGDEVGAFNESGTLKGCDTVRTPGHYGYMLTSGSDGDSISFRVVSKSRKREYSVTTVYVMDGCSMLYYSVEIHLSTGAEYDSDSDGMCDYWEWFYSALGFDPDVYSDPGNDADGDGATDIQEYNADTDPGSADTDGDGYADGIEIDAGSDPNDPGETPGAIRINFQPQQSGRLTGYSADTGDPYSARGYGWFGE